MFCLWKDNSLFDWSLFKHLSPCFFWADQSIYSFVPIEIVWNCPKIQPEFTMFPILSWHLNVSIAIFVRQAAHFWTLTQGYLGPQRRLFMVINHHEMGYNADNYGYIYILNLYYTYIYISTYNPQVSNHSLRILVCLGGSSVVKKNHSAEEEATEFPRELRWWYKIRLCCLVWTVKVASSYRLFSSTFIKPYYI